MKIGILIVRLQHLHFQHCIHNQKKAFCFHRIGVMSNNFVHDVVIHKGKVRSIFLEDSILEMTFFKCSEKLLWKTWSCFKNVEGHIMRK